MHRTAIHRFGFPIVPPDHIENLNKYQHSLYSTP